MLRGMQRMIAAEPRYPAEPIHNRGLRPMRSISSTVTMQAPMLSAPDNTLIISASFPEKPTACHSAARQ